MKVFMVYEGVAAMFGRQAGLLLFATSWCDQGCNVTYISMLPIPLCRGKRI